MSARRLLVCAWVALGALVLGVACSISEDSDGGAGGGESAPDITTLCEEECIPLYPAGEVPYRNLRGCVFCGACFDVCTAELGAAICPDGGGDLGCSVQSTDCATCINGACALLQNPDTSFIGACAVPGQQCGDVVECVSLNNCVADCVADGGPSTASASSSTSTAVSGSSVSSVSSTGTGG